MATKVFTSDLKIGMFVADLDRPWVDTPFLLQGFLIEDEEQIAALRNHCEYVIVDRARSTGDQFQAPSAAEIARKVGTSAPSAPARPITPSAVRTPSGELPEVRVDKDGKEHKLVKLEDIARRGRKGGRVPDAEGYEGGPRGGGLGRMFSGLKGMFSRGGNAAADTPPPPEPPPQETPQEFEARASLLPPGIAVQTYINQASIEAEVPRAREVVATAGDLLDKLVSDIRLGQSFEVDRVEEIVQDMVDSIVRNPQALMWVARLRETDIATYGHGLQVSVYITAFARHLGFPKPQLSLLAQVGLLLDIGKIRLPRELLEKQGRLDRRGIRVGKGARLPWPGNPRRVELCPRGDRGHLAASRAHERQRLPERAHERGDRHLRAHGGDRRLLRGAHEPSALRRRGVLVRGAAKHHVLGRGLLPRAAGAAVRLLRGSLSGGLAHRAVHRRGAVVVEHSKVRRLKPRVLVVTGADKAPAPYPTMLDLLYDPKVGEEAVFIKRGLASGAYGLDLRDFYLA
jgi:HD-GYP domain